MCNRSVWSVAVSWQKLVYDTVLYFMFVLCVTDLYGLLLFLCIDPFWVQQGWLKLVYDTELYVCTRYYKSVWSVAVSWHKLVYDTILYFMFVLCVIELYGLLLFLGIDPFWVQQWWHKLVYDTILYVCTVRYRSVWSVAVSRH